MSPDEDTVWLTQKDLTILFGVDKSRISRHIKNIFKQGELDISVVAENAITGSDGKTYFYKEVEENKTRAKNARVLSNCRPYIVDVYN